MRWRLFYLYRISFYAVEIKNECGRANDALPHFLILKKGKRNA